MTSSALADRPVPEPIAYKLLQAVNETLDEATVASLAVATIAAETGWPGVWVVLVDRINGLSSPVGGGIAPPDEWVASLVGATAPQFQPEAPAWYGLPLRRGELALGALAVLLPAEDEAAPAQAEVLAETLSGVLNNARRFTDMRRRLQRLRALQEATAVFAQHLDLTTVLQKIAEQLAKAVDATSAYICGYNEKSQTVTVLAEYLGARASEKERISDLGVTYYLPDTFPDDIEFLAEGEPSIGHIDDPDLSPEERLHFEQYGGKTSLAIPLRWREKTIAYAELWETEYRREYSEGEVELCRSIAQQAVIALENARLFNELEQKLVEQNVLREAIAAISSSLELNVVLQRIAEQMGQLLDVTSVYICSYDQDRATSTVLAEYFGPLANEAERISDIGVTYFMPRDYPGAAAHLDAGKAKVAHIDDPDLGTPERSHMEVYGGRSTLRIPLRFRDRTIAYAELWQGNRRRDFTAEEIDLCHSVAQHAAIAIENARLFQAVRDERGRLQALIEAERDGVILVGMDGHILVVNQTALTFLHLTGEPSAWIDRPFTEALAALRRALGAANRAVADEIKRAWLRGLTAESNFGEGEVDLPPYSIYWLKVLARADDDLAVGQLFVLRDITEERQLTRLREDLTHTMVHDLRGPLTAISMSLDMLVHTEGDMYQRTTRQRAYDRARGSTQRLLKLINDILDISKLESGHQPLQYQLIFFKDLLDPVIELQQPLAEAKQIELVTDVPSNLPLLRVDRSLIERVLQNLVENGLKYTPNGGQVAVQAEVTENSLLVTVRDTGPGVDLGADAFAKFRAGRHPGRGSGLGLYFCRLALVAHGQRIWLDSNGSQGTVFYFSLPLA